VRSAFEYISRQRAFARLFARESWREFCCFCKSQAFGAADGYRECVGNVGRTGRLWQAEVILHAALHLMFFGSAAAGEELFDECGFEFEQGVISLRDGEKQHAASVGHDGGGVGVSGVSEEAFDGDGVGLDAIEQFAKVVIEFFETLADTCGIASLAIGATKTEDASFDEGVVADACEFDAAVTGESQAGIDAEDTHSHLIDQSA